MDKMQERAQEIWQNQDWSNSGAYKQIVEKYANEFRTIRSDVVMKFLNIASRWGNDAIIVALKDIVEPASPFGSDCKCWRPILGIDQGWRHVNGDGTTVDINAISGFKYCPYCGEPRPA